MQPGLSEAEPLLLAFAPSKRRGLQAYIKRG